MGVVLRHPHRRLLLPGDRMNDDLVDIKASLERLVKATEEIVDLVAYLAMLSEQRRVQTDIDDTIFKATALPLAGRVDLITEENEALRRLLDDQ